MTKWEIDAEVRCCGSTAVVGGLELLDCHNDPRRPWCMLAPLQTILSAEDLYYAFQTADLGDHIADGEGMIYDTSAPKCSLLRDHHR